MVKNYISDGKLKQKTAIPMQKTAKVNNMGIKNMEVGLFISSFTSY